MTNTVQLLSFLRYILTFLFILDISLSYILFMYYVNHGVIHIYFIIVTLIGYFVEKKIHQNVKKYVKFCHGIAERFHR